MHSPSPKPAILDAAAAVAADLGTDLEQGLATAEATRRLAAEGANELPTTPPRPAWRRLLAQFDDPLVYLLLGAVGIALVAWVAQGRHWPVDAIVITLVVIVNAVLGFIQEAKAENAVAALARMTAVTSSVLRRAIFDNIRKFLRYLLSSNMGEVLTVFLGVVGAGLLGLSGSGQELVLPLLATQILWINLITDSGPALAMGVDPETDDVMARRPRRPGDRAIDTRMWKGVLELGLVMAIATLLTIDMYLPGGLIEGERDLANARTAGFTVLVLAQLFNCFNARSETTSAFHRLFVNPWLWGAIALSLLLQIAVVNVDMLNVAFGTVPLDARQWIVCVAMGSAVLWFSELRKAAIRAFSGRSPAASP